jgi:hypothetical protein
VMRAIWVVAVTCSTGIHFDCSVRLLHTALATYNLHTALPTYYGSCQPLETSELLTTIIGRIAHQHISACSPNPSVVPGSLLRKMYRSLKSVALQSMWHCRQSCLQGYPMLHKVWDSGELGLK